jgi:hypothetical protein
MNENSEQPPGQDRRSERRVPVAADIEWASAGDMIPGRLGDLSSNGCFVLTAGEFADGEIVRLFFPMTDGTKLEILAEIRNYVEDIGFAARFISLSDAQREFVRSFAELHQMADTES